MGPSRHIINKSILIFALYAAIFNPPILTFNLINVIGPLAWVYLIMNYNRIPKLLNLHYVKTLVGLLLLLESYLCIVALINDNSIFGASTLPYIILWDIPVALAFLVQLKKWKYGTLEALDVLLEVGLLLAFTSILAFFIPPIHQYFSYCLIRYGVEVNELISIYRNYGFAANLSSHASYLQAIFAIISIHLFINKSIKKYIYFVPFFIFSAIINTRTSIVILLIGLVMVVIYNLRIKKLGNSFSIYVLLAVILYFIPFVITENNRGTFEWIETGTSQITAYSKSDKSNYGYFDYLESAERWSLPEDTEGVLLGKGTSIFGSGSGSKKYGRVSDIGFTNDIWRGGLFYSFTIYILVLIMLYRIAHVVREKKVFILISIFLLFCAIVVNTKATFFGHSDDFFFFLILYLLVTTEKTSSIRVRNMHHL